MKTTLFLLIFLLNHTLFSQTIPYNSSYLAVDTTCVWDSDIEFTTTIGWTAYQTIDDTYNGIVDSSICLSLKEEETYGGISFLMNAFDTSRSLFIKADLTDLNKINLQKDAAYLIYDGFFTSLLNLDLSIDCADLVCSAIILGIEIPDSTLTATTTRWHFINASSFDGGFCFPTEKFETQFLTDYIIKLTFENATETIFKKWTNPYLEEVYDATLITDLTNSDGFYEDTTYVIKASNIFGFSTLGILKYDDPFYPSTEHFDYIDVTPDPNPSEVTAINIEIEEYYSLLTQPLVQLRGGFAEGDTLRHQVNLINNGGTFCLSIAEMVFTGNTNYIFNSGKLEMYGPTSCVMFKNGAAIKVADSSSLQYGNNGVGVLGLGSGGTIVLGKGASLFINNRVSLVKDPNSNYSGDIYMNLNKGNTLGFGEGASITNDAKSVIGAHLCIFMNGGDLDLSGLNEESKKLIRLIYPVPSADFSEKINIFPNPTSDIFTAEIQIEKPQKISIRITDLNGKVLQQQNADLTSGINAIKISVKNIENGIFLVNFITESEQGIKRLVKL